MKYFAVWILTFAFILPSCKKEALNFEFSGNVKSVNNEANLSDVEIEVSAFGLGNTTKSVLETVKTDENGNYTLKVERGKYEKVRFSLKKEHYFDEEKSYSFENLSTSKVNEFDFKISPMSWTKFIIKNITSQSPDDVLKIQKVSGRTDCNKCWNNTTFFFQGVLDTAVYVPNDGDSYMKFYYWLNDSELDEGVGNIFNTPFDTIPFEFIY